MGLTPEVSFRRSGFWKQVVQFDSDAETFATVNIRDAECFVLKENGHAAGCGVDHPNLGGAFL
jgi:hypothetical protein